MVKREGVVKLFITEFIRRLVLAQRPCHPHSHEMVDHGCQQDGHEVVFSALPVERLVEMVGLVPGSELDLPAGTRLFSGWLSRCARFHAPTSPVDRTQLVGREVRDGEVRKHKVPAVADQAHGVGFDTFCLGFFPSLFPSLFSDRAAGAYRHEATTLLRLARFHR